MFHSEALQVPGTVQVLQGESLVRSQKPRNPAGPNQASAHQIVSGSYSLTCRLCSNSSSTRVLTPNSWSISSSSLACGKRKGDW